MESTLEAEFISVATDPAAFFSIKSIMENLFATAHNLGVFFDTWVVQFKTRI